MSGKILSDYKERSEKLYQSWNQNSINTIREYATLVFNTNQPSIFELSQTENNSINWFNIKIVPLNKYEVLASIHNVSQKLRVEAEQDEMAFIIKTQFDYGLSGILILDQHLNVFKANKTAQCLLQYSFDELNSTSWNNLICAEDRDYDEYIFQKLVEKKISIFESEKRLLSKNGKEIDVTYCINLFNNKLTGSHFFLITFSDVSFRKEHERALLNTVIETEEIERMNFAQEVHDGIGPILASIKMYVQWLMSSNTKTDKSEIIKDIEIQVNEAQKAIREVAFKLSPHILKNFGLIEAIRSFIDKLAHTKAIQFEVTSSINEQRFNDTSEIIIYRTLTECINNSLKHANAKTIKIDFAESKNGLKITFEDDGIGFNTSEVLNSAARGNGLFNIKHRIASINGTIQIFSSPGHGTKIIIKLKTN